MRIGFMYLPSHRYIGRAHGNFVSSQTGHDGHGDQGDIESVTRLPEALGDTTAKPPHSGQPQLARSRLARGWFSSPLQ
jgi:hypothetical protein